MRPCDHRISVPISEEMHKRLQQIFPWGTQAEAIRRVLELLIAKIDKEGYNVVQKLISGSYDPLSSDKSDGQGDKL
jgi:hypothetical protein